MATKKRKRSPLKGIKHTHKGTIRKHKRRVNGINPPIVAGMRRKKRTTSKKMGSITGNDTLDVALGALGGVVATILIDKFVPIDNVKIKKSLETLAGAGLAYYAHKKKSMALTGAAIVIFSDGAHGLATEMGLLQGMKDIMGRLGMSTNPDDAMIIRMNGTYQQNMMGDTSRGGSQNVLGNSNPPVIS